MRSRLALATSLLVCAVASASAAEPYRCRDPNTHFVYERPQRCATGDVTLSGPPVTSSGRQTDIYAQGTADWRGLKTWFDTLTGDRRDGADYWAANRNRPNHLACASDASAGATDELAFLAGCEEAKRRLDPIDTRRADPQYRAGFNDEAKRSPIVSATTLTSGVSAVVKPGAPVAGATAAHAGVFETCISRVPSSAPGSAATPYMIMQWQQQRTIDCRQEANEATAEARKREAWQQERDTYYAMHPEKRLSTADAGPGEYALFLCAGFIPENLNRCRRVLDTISLALCDQQKESIGPGGRFTTYEGMPDEGRNIPGYAVCGHYR